MLLPFVLAFILVGLPNDPWTHAWFWLVVWTPLLFVGQFLPQYLSTDIWPADNALFLHYLYPLLSFLVWYLVSCTIALFVRKRTWYHITNLLLIACMFILYLYVIGPRR
jgi:hypothetical protein